MTRKIIVTGGLGFIGSHLVKKLTNLNYQIFVIDNFSSPSSNRLPGSISVIRQDIADSKLVDTIQKIKPAVIYHLAAESRVSGTLDKIIHNNIIGTYNVLEAAKAAQVKQLIFTSSAAVYGEVRNFPIQETSALKPISLYGLSKLTGELYCRQFKKFFPTVIFRLANVYGPFQNSSAEGGVVPIFLNQIQRGITPLIYGNGQQTRDFIHVSDVVTAMIRALSFSQSGIFNISTGQETTINQLLKLCGNGKTKLKAKLVPARGRDIVRSVLANHLAVKNLHWQPKVKLADGLLSL
ncbi:MAG: NAD-dependent epimerase/dehydratase family protein [Candidatus Beckwithbacteria bacterium]|nr:NAD-dependent epimerase/dehydratase family protein [Candidatus Beckwithbacteria bacterium]